MRSLAYELFILLVSILSIVNLFVVLIGWFTGFGDGAPNEVVLLDRGRPDSGLSL